MKISSRGNRLLIYIVKRNTKTDGMGPFKSKKSIAFVTSGHQLLTSDNNY